MTAVEDVRPVRALLAWLADFAEADNADDRGHSTWADTKRAESLTGITELLAATPALSATFPALTAAVRDVDAMRMAYSQLTDQARAWCSSREGPVGDAS